jgi:DNA polymerase III delta prime subunit
LTQENKVAILEEVDNMTKAAQKALLTIIENAAVSFQQHYSTKFILVANDAHKLIESLQSRCLPISFNPYSVNLDETKSTLLKTIECRFDEIEVPFCRESVQRIVDSSYPEFILRVQS